MRGRVGLRVGVYQEGLVTPLGQLRGQRCRSGALPDAALLVSDRDDRFHSRPPSNV